MNKLIESFNSLNEQSRYAVVVAFVFLIIFLDVFFLAMPQMGSISDNNDQIKKLSDDTQQVLTDRLGVNKLKKDLQKQRDDLKSLSSKVRPIQDVPSILSTISSIANEYGVKIDQMVPEKSQQEILAESTNGKYYSLPVVIKARCGYHKFGHFLSSLEGENMYFILKDFIIQNDDNDPHSHLFSLTLKFILIDEN